MKLTARVLAIASGFILLLAAAPSWGGSADSGCAGYALERHTIVDHTATDASVFGGVRGCPSAVAGGALLRSAGRKTRPTQIDLDFQNSAIESWLRKRLDHLRDTIERQDPSLVDDLFIFYQPTAEPFDVDDLTLLNSRWLSGGNLYALTRAQRVTLLCYRLHLESTQMFDRICGPVWTSGN